MFRKKDAIHELCNVSGDGDEFHIFRLRSKNYPVDKNAQDWRCEGQISKFGFLIRILISAISLQILLRKEVNNLVSFLLIYNIYIFAI